MSQHPPTQSTPPQIAVVGAGISGLVAARALNAVAEVTLFEAEEQAGGHANTVDITLAGITHGVDTGFLVYNARTYPGLIELFQQLGIPRTPSNMGFSVQVHDPRRAERLEWSGNHLNSVFADRQNLLRPQFWGMLRDMVRFNFVAKKLLQESPQNATPPQTLGAFIAQPQWGHAFVHHYFLPMVSCIWSCAPAQMMDYPLIPLLRFCDNHGLLQIVNRPQWYTVAGGSRHYIARILQQLPRVQTRTKILALTRQAEGITLEGSHQGKVFASRFDAVIIATHSDQALALLGHAATALERECLSAIRYQENTAVLHTDVSMMPTRRRAWAAWNYEKMDQDSGQRVCLHYWLNALQPLPFNTPVMVSLNPLRPIDPNKIHRTFSYTHPIFNTQALSAQKSLPDLLRQAENTTRTWFAGAWSQYGFHEDGLQSGLLAAESVRRALNLPVSP